MKKYLSVTLVLALTLLLTVSVRAQDKKSLSLGFTQEPDNLNYVYSNMYFSFILGTLWNSPPWIFDDTLAAIPWQAKEIPTADNGGVSADGKTITIKLRDDIKWSDGEPITSADYVFTFDMHMTDKNSVNSRAPYDKMDSVTAPDAQTVVVKFKDIYAPWLTTIFPYVLPAHVLQPVFDSAGTLDGAEFNKVPSVSSGPFVVTEWQAGQYILFSRNDNYFDAPAKLDQVFVRVIPDDAAQVAALINGDIDLGIFIAPDDAKTLQEKGLTIITVPGGYNEGLYFNFKAEASDNHNPEVTSDVNVRRAIAYALNRQQIVEELQRYGSGANDFNPVADGFWHNTPWANPDILHEVYDPNVAKGLLDDAGWKDTNGDGIREKEGVDLKLNWSTTTRQVRKNVQAVGQQQLKEVGIEVDLVNLESDIFFGSYADASPIARGDYDIQEFSGNISFPDPNVDRWLCSEIPSDANQSGTNDQYLCDEKLDALFQEQAKTADPDARRKIFFEIQQLIHNQVYWLPLWHDPDIWALSGRFENARIAGTTQFWNSGSWDVGS